MKFLKMLIVLFIITLFFFSCKKENLETQDLIIFHAGSLSVPFKEVKAEFNKTYPNVNILLESAGSRTCARKISELNKPCDVMASADYSVIDNLLIPKDAEWNVKFASNEMAIVYSEKSEMAEKINKDNWFEVLLDKKVAYGRSDPNSDPCGYRAIFTMKLAEMHYNKPGLANKMMSKDQNYIRPKEVDLLALLETHTIDYLFLYRSVAQQHKLKYIVLPDEINLKKSGLKDYYQKAAVQISGETPGSFITKKGAPMVYGVTIPKNAPNYKIALKFVIFLLDKNKGLAIMSKNGQPPIILPQTDYYDKMPLELKKYVAK